MVTREGSVPQGEIFSGLPTISSFGVTKNENPTSEHLVDQLVLLDPGEPTEIAFAVYHDESGTYVRDGGSRWLLHGLILLPIARQREAFLALQEVRKETGYWEEVHYAKLRKSVSGSKARCANGWLSAYASRLSDFCFYHCLAIDTKSPSFEHDRFSSSYHVYNRFALMALVSAIAWSLKQHQRIALKLHSDAKSRVEGDNFASYIPRELLHTIDRKRSEKPNSYPEIELLHPQVVLVDSNPTKAPDEMQEECELTQLTDLLTSAIAQAITGSSGQKAKIALAETVGRWIEDTRKPPWLQTKDLHRRFAVSCFPDANGRFYNPVLAVMDPFKIPLFEDSEDDLV